jgi:2-isopropylmalate synthase
MQARLIRIFDTTLRDGEQAPGNSMTVDQKVEVAMMLEDLGTNTVEAGFPVCSPADALAVREIARAVKNAKICCMCRCNSLDVDAALGALEHASEPQIELVAVGSDIHLKYKRRISRDEAVRELVESIERVRAVGIEDIIFSLEDGTRGSLEHRRALVKAGVEAGGTQVLIPDTVGCAVPQEMRDLVTETKAWSQGVPVGVHCHDDLGLATANTLAAIEAGAVEVQVTLCGIGERAGNTSYEEVVAALHSKQDHYGCWTTVRLDRLYPASQRLLETISERLPRAKAIVGENAFATEAGIHQQGILNHPSTYEFLDPGTFGRERRLVVGRHSGRAVIRHKVADAEGMDPDPAIVDRLYRELVEGDDFPAFGDDLYLQERYRELAGGGERRKLVPGDGA